MLKLNKNSRNMCCALAVAAVVFIIVKCMQSEDYKREKLGCETKPDGTKVCAHKYGKDIWTVIKNKTTSYGRSSGRSDKVKNVRSCLKKCNDMGSKCASFVYHSGSKSCVYRPADQFPLDKGTSEIIGDKKGTHVYFNTQKYSDAGIKR